MVGITACEDVYETIIAKYLDSSSKRFQLLFVK